MLEAFQQPFFLRVLLAGLLASVVSGVVGTYVVVKRMSTVGGGLAHAAFGGVGMGYLLGFDPILGAAGFGLACGVGIGLAYRRLRSSIDTSISMVWSAGMALGLLFVALAPGYAPDMTSYLFGSLLFASWDYVMQMAVLDAVLLLVAFALFEPLQAVAFDEEFAEITGLPVDGLLLLLLGLVSLSVVTLIRVVGVILAIALLTVPAATARLWTATLRGMMLGAVAIGACCTALGLWGSYTISARVEASLPSGPMIILTTVLVYLVSFVWRRVRDARAG